MFSPLRALAIRRKCGLIIPPHLTCFQGLFAWLDTSHLFPRISLPLMLGNEPPMAYFKRNPEVRPVGRAPSTVIHTYDIIKHVLIRLCLLPLARLGMLCPWIVLKPSIAIERRGDEIGQIRGTVEGLGT